MRRLLATLRGVERFVAFFFAERAAAGMVPMELSIQFGLIFRLEVSRKSRPCNLDLGQAPCEDDQNSRAGEIQRVQTAVIRDEGHQVRQPFVPTETRAILTNSPVVAKS